MILLKQEEYPRLIEPLQDVKINKLFARAVVEKRISGKVYVDSISQPETFYVLHPYGMSLLFGNWNNKTFNTAFRDYALNSNQVRNHHEWMQTYPADWDIMLQNLLKGSIIKSAENTAGRVTDIVELNTRVNFKFNPEKYYVLRRRVLDSNISILPIDRKHYSEMTGSVVPSKFWNNDEDFMAFGIGFSLVYQNQLAAMSFSSCLIDSYLELGIETRKEYRGRGFAKQICAALIDYCLEHGYEPIWSCSLENRGSYHLAMSLGFEPIYERAYYKLSR